MFWTVLFLIAAFPAGLCAENTNRAPFQIGGMSVPPGRMMDGYIPVPEKDGLKTVIPVTVIHGAEKGGVLALVAGVHGFEYPPILALYRIKNLVSPADLAGTLILVHIANLPGFQKRIIYYNPFDWKNLNRVFPGAPNGTLSERIAFVLKKEIVEKCDYLIDLHCGDGNEALIPYCYWMVSGNEEVDKTSREMVLAFGIRRIIIDSSRTKDISQSKYLGNTAVLHEKPAITTESGFLGGTDELSIVRNVRGILSVMRLLKMLPGEPSMAEDPVWIDRYEVIYSAHDGLFYPLTEMGYYASEGEKIGYVTDYLGRVVEEFRAPFSGMILYIVQTPPANKGEPLYEIGRVKSKQQKGGAPVPH